jgi:hypothetical protein
MREKVASFPNNQTTVAHQGLPLHTFPFIHL